MFALPTIELTSILQIDVIGKRDQTVSIAISPDNSKIAIYMFDSSIDVKTSQCTIYSLTDGKILSSLFTNRSTRGAKINGELLAFLPDNNTLMLTHEEKMLEIWDTTNVKIIGWSNFEEGIISISSNHSGDLIAVASFSVFASQSAITIIEAPKAEPNESAPVAAGAAAAGAHPAPECRIIRQFYICGIAGACRFSTDGLQLTTITAMMSPIGITWSVASGRPLKSFPIPTGAKNYNFSLDCTRIICLENTYKTAKNGIQTYILALDSPVITKIPAFAPAAAEPRAYAYANTIAIDPKNTYLVSTHYGMDNTVLLSHAKAGKLVALLNTKKTNIKNCIFTNDGLKIIVIHENEAKDTVISVFEFPISLP